MNIPLNCMNVYTTPKQAEQINKIILKYVDKNSIITDATSCIGGNSILFSRDFKKVICIEKDFNIYKILKSNMIKQNNTECYNASYNIVKFILKQNVIFIDPPWGGNNYKNKKNVKLYLDSIDIQYIINEVYNFTDIVVLKTPLNFDTTTLNNLFWSYVFYPIIKYNKPIYNIIVFYKHI